MRGIATLMLFAGLVLATCQGQGPFDNNWLKELLAGVDQSNKKLQADLANMNRQIQTNVNSQVDQINKNVNAQVAQVNRNVAESLKNLDKAEFVRYPGTSYANNGQSVIISNRAGSSRSVQSGTDSNGQPYYIENEDQVIGDKLIHTTRVYNHTTKNFDIHRYTLNLKDPNAQPVILKPNESP